MSRCAKADAFAANVRQIEVARATTNRAIAEALNARAIRTARGGDWHRSTVWNLLARAVCTKWRTDTATGDRRQTSADWGLQLDQKLPDR